MGKHIWMMLFDCIILIPNQERTKLKTETNTACIPVQYGVHYVHRTDSTNLHVLALIDCVQYTVQYNVSLLM